MNSEISTEERSIHFTIDIEDMIAFNEYHYIRSPTGIKRMFQRRVAFSVPIAILLLFLGSMMHRDLSWVFGIWFPPGLAFIGVIGYNYLELNYLKSPTFFRNKIRKFYSIADNRSVLGEHLLRIGQDGFVSASKYLETRLSWGVLGRIETDSNYTYLYVSAVNAVIIPHDKITEGDFPALLQAIKTHYKPDQQLIV